MTQSEKIKRKAKLLNRAFNFTAEDLQANRTGKLTPRQRDALTRHGIIWLIQAGAIALILIFLMPVVMLSKIPPVIAALTPLIVLSSLMSVLYRPVLYYWHIRKALHVKSLIIVEGYGYIRGQNLIIDGTKIRLNHQQRKSIDTTAYLFLYCISILELRILSFEAGES